MSVVESQQAIKANKTHREQPGLPDGGYSKLCMDESERVCRE